MLLFKYKTFRTSAVKFKLAASTESSTSANLMEHHHALCNHLGFQPSSAPLHPTVCPSVHPSIQSIHPSIHSSIHPPIHPSSTGGRGEALTISASKCRARGGSTLSDPHHHSHGEMFLICVCQKETILRLGSSRAF